jgi:hypothetical protein
MLAANMDRVSEGLCALLEKEGKKEEKKCPRRIYECVSKSNVIVEVRSEQKI